MKTCKKCGHKWLPRVEHPIQCPRCKSLGWDKGSEEVETDRFWTDEQYGISIEVGDRW